ncbi:MAG TPA: isoprenyl transferase [Prolixibacteraceae bacterium]|nr:isoprenyl transferase [Prolixibacteraceae bacterium]HPT30266.1 isoprenyl transferase [Prolixibacteraceae bacterium]
MTISERLHISKVPRHVAIIMDGNGRWAARHGSVRTIGHEQGIEAVRSTVEGAGEIGIDYLTLFAFSTENWYRPVEEVNALMSLLVHAIDAETDNLMKNNVRVTVIGETSKLPEHVRLKLMGCVDRLKNNTGLTVIFALSYSSKWEITEAARKIASDVLEGKVNPDDINNQLFEKYLSTSGIPDPELLIRTSGEYRISNFLLWQIAYAELYFTEVLWPDFRKEDLFRAIQAFQDRERRFGLTSEQITS